MTTTIPVKKKAQQQVGLVREHDPTLLGNTRDKLTDTVLIDTVRRQFP